MIRFHNKTNEIKTDLEYTHNTQRIINADQVQ